MSFGKLWVVGDNLRIRHAGSEPSENIGNGDPRSANRRPTAAFSRLDGDDVLIGH
jgi:hypothetical protein